MFSPQIRELITGAVLLIISPIRIGLSLPFLAFAWLFVRFLLPRVQRGSGATRTLYLDRRFSRARLLILKATFRTYSWIRGAYSVFFSQRMLTSSSEGDVGYGYSDGGSYVVYDILGKLDSDGTRGFDQVWIRKLKFLGKFRIRNIEHLENGFAKFHMTWISGINQGMGFSLTHVRNLDDIRGEAANRIKPDFFEVSPPIFGIITVVFGLILVSKFALEYLELVLNLFKGLYE